MDSIQHDLGRDTRPSYSAVRAVHDIVAVLTRADIALDIAPAQVERAAEHAASLLGAIGVRPITSVTLTVPEHRPGGGTWAEYSPVSVVLDLKEALAAQGIVLAPRPNQMHTASIAAIDLLRALGVRPASAPRRYPDAVAS